jgi:4-hydroxy-3-polyprenylbenzoate decarboxylase
MKLVIAATGASGSIYLQRLLDLIPAADHEIHLVLSNYAKQVVIEELGSLRIPDSVIQHGDRSMNVPFASGSTRFDAMVICPCSMGSLARIAAGTADTTILRAADVFLKERRKLIVVPRETPWNLIHARNVVTLLEAGATVMPASPAFYSGATTLNDIADSLVTRILDQLNLPAPNAFRWKESSPCAD